MAGFAGQRVIKKDPTVWLDGARIRLQVSKNSLFAKLPINGK